MSLLLLPCEAQAQNPVEPLTEPVRVSSIRFEGNKVTRDAVMLREIELRAGEEADSVQIEDARQAIQDLGLFRSVNARSEPCPDGAIVTFAVREKTYLLPVPRIEANSDGDRGYGVQIRWSNVLGMNHSLRSVLVQRQFEEADRSGGLFLSATYTAPQVMASRYTLAVSAGHSQEDLIESGLVYDDTQHNLGLRVTRPLSDEGSANQGWSVGGGPSWSQQTISGRGPEAEVRQIVALGSSATYRDMRFDVYSERGQSLELSWSSTAFGAFSDYEYAQWGASWRHAQQLGTRRHQSLNVLVDVGAYHGGALGEEPTRFGLGGSSVLRGYDKEALQGDFYYYLGAEYLRPLHGNAVRLLVLAEAGSTARDWRDAPDRRVFASLGLGLRLRFTRFVNLEVELGLATPLVKGSDSVRVFAGGV